MDPDSPNEGRDAGDDRKNIKLTERVHALFAREAVRLGLSQPEVAELALISWIDRCGHAYDIENAYLLRDIQALELRVEQLTLANLAVAEMAVALEGAGLRSLLKLVAKVRAEVEVEEKGVEA